MPASIPPPLCDTHIGEALAGLDLLGMARSNRDPAELAATIPDREVAKTLAVARVFSASVFIRPEEAAERSFWEIVAKHLSEREGV